MYTDDVRGVRDGSDCFFFNDTATTEIYTLSLHDALPILALLWYHVYIYFMSTTADQNYNRV